MADEDLKKLSVAQLRKIVEDERALATQTSPVTGGGGAGGAFVDQADMPTVTGQAPDITQAPLETQLGRLGANVGGAYAGEKASEPFAKAATTLLPEKYKIPAELVIRGGGAAAGAFAGSLGWLNLERPMRMPGAPDNFDQALQMSYKAALDQFQGSAMGTLAGKAGELNPVSRGNVDPSRLDTMSRVMDNMKATYERIGGAPMVTDYQSRWSPMRIFRPLETELDDQAVVQRLKAQGLDPYLTRKLVLQGGVTAADLLDNAPYRIMQAIAEGTPVGGKYMQSYMQNRSKFYRLVLDDMADEFGKAIPPEQMGTAIRGAINGNFNLPNAIAQNSIEMVGKQLNSWNPDFTFDLQGMRNYFKRQNVDMNSPAATAIFGGIPGKEMPRQVPWESIKTIRQNLATIAYSMDDTIPDKYKTDAKMMLKTFDNGVRKQLSQAGGTGGAGMPLDDLYHLGARADDVLYQGQMPKNKNVAQEMNTQFVKKLLDFQGGNEAYAEYLLKNSDLGNFRKLEAAVGPGSGYMDNLKAVMSQRALQGVVREDGTLNPAAIEQMLQQNGTYGKYFLAGTLGKKWVENAELHQKAMDMLNEAAVNRTMSGMGIGSYKMDTAGPVLNTLFRGTLPGRAVSGALGLFGVPQIVSRVLTSPNATKNIQRLAQLAATGDRPHTFERIVMKTIADIGLTPEAVAQAVGAPGTTKMGTFLDELGRGQFPTTGNLPIDLMFNPATAIANIATGKQNPPPGSLGR